MVAMHEVLVLDKSYLPISIVSKFRGFCMAMGDNVDVIDYQPILIHTATKGYPVPSIIRVTNMYSPHLMAKKAHLCHENLYMRDDHTCAYCGDKFNRRNLTWDHILPISRGGKTTWDNLVTACKDCNLKKGNRTPKEAGMDFEVIACTPARFDQTIYEYGVRDEWLIYLEHFISKSKHMEKILLKHKERKHA